LREGTSIPGSLSLLPLPRAKEREREPGIEVVKEVGFI